MVYEIEGELKLVGGNSIIELPLEIGQNFHSKAHKRLLCTIGEHPVHLALNRRKEGSFYIRIGKKHLKAANQEREGKISFRLEPDNSTNQFEESEVLQEVLMTDPEALEIWNSFTPGRKRSFIAYITSVKSTDLRIERALKITECFKMGITNPREVAKIKL
ncbi:MAG: YdeI/OmpD-associated family protein [Bacteroidia bacterium]|nr:YdeI/OmpD-associated family protein [Bacteroidia bacterium]